MFLKYGKKDNLEKLKDGGIFFSPCKVFQNIEKEQLNKGQGDQWDGTLTTKAIEVELYADGFYKKLSDIDFSVIVSKSENTPIFCIKAAESYHVTQEQYKKIRIQSPDWTHVLVIEDESAFLENIRFNMRNKAFAHKVFYENVICDDFIEFLRFGKSDIRFYTPKYKKSNDYMYMKVKLFADSNEVFIRIDDSNYYMTMYKKDVFFKGQNEYRIVLPYESITQGKLYDISPFEADIFEIEETII